MPRTRHYTVADVLALPNDGNRYEVVHGELLVSPAPGGRHQYILGKLRAVLNSYLMAHGLDPLLESPGDITFGPETLVQPDLFVADLTELKKTWKWEDVRILHLVVEGTSPSTERYDRVVKRPLYQEREIPEYWIVDIDQSQVEVWTPGATEPRLEREQLIWRHPDVEDTCTIDLFKLFSV